MAKDCLGVALGMYVEAREGIPAPSPLEEDLVLISVAPIVAAKLALYSAMREQGLTHVALANRLGLQEKAVRRFLDPGYRSPMASVEKALGAVGRSPIVEESATVNSGDKFRYTLRTTSKDESTQ